MTSHYPDKPQARTWTEHLRARVNAERKRAQAQRAYNGLQRQTRTEVRQLRRAGKTAGIVARSRLAEIAVRACAALVAKWRRPQIPTTEE
jgi:hypothetical protein